MFGWWRVFTHSVIVRRPSAQRFDVLVWVCLSSSENAGREQARVGRTQRGEGHTLQVSPTDTHHGVMSTLSTHHPLTLERWQLEIVARLSEFFLQQNGVPSLSNTRGVTQSLSVRRLFSPNIFIFSLGLYFKHKILCRICKLLLGH